MTLESSYALMYFELNIVSVILVLVILFKTNGLTKMIAQINFSHALYSQIAFFLSDTVYVIMKCGYLPYYPAAVMVIKTIYFFSTVTMCYFWFLYYEYLQGTGFIKKKINRVLSSFLVPLMGILLVINLFNGMLFYVREDGVYVRGDLFVISYVIAYVYVFVAAVRMMITQLSVNVTQRRHGYVLLVLLPLAPALAGIFQYIFPEVPLACVTLSLATFFMYLNSVDEVISIDPLTLLNNRKQLQFYYDQYAHGRGEDKSLYLLIIDANRFKKINDTYGHVQGDEALVRIATAMKNACRRFGRRYNAARIGGDEFVILTWAGEDEEINRLCDMISEELKTLNERAKAPYELTVSIGISKEQSSRRLSLKELIEAADEQLYDVKEALR